MAVTKIIELVGSSTTSSDDAVRAAFKSNRLLAVDALFILGVAFTVLAATYLAVQYMLALKRSWFLLPLGAVAVAEPILLLQASHEPKPFATVVLGVQVAGALVAFGLALRPERRGKGGRKPEEDVPEPELVGASGLS